MTNRFSFSGRPPTVGTFWLSLLLALAAISSCRCRPGPVDPVELGLRVNPTEVDFGRVLEGDTRTATVTLTASTRAPVNVTLSTSEPFGVSPTEVEVPGGGDATITVRFRAGNGTSEGALTLTVGELSAQVPLRGFGVRPPPCLPSGECIISEYSLEEDRCIERQAPDDAACDPSSVCLEQGRCRMGACLGVARRCDDDDACTDDACAMDVGCIHTPHVCPSPTMACQVATCDARMGCGFGNAPDLDRCGPIDCVEANFCFQGACRRQPTPEGYPCSPAIACLPEATCQNQMCTRELEGNWTPDWSAPLVGRPTGQLASLGATIFFSMCLDVDAGLPEPDAGFDAGVDAGLDGGGLDPSDGGEVDAGELDAGEPDAGAVDASVDAGSDGGFDASVPLVCGLSSYTGTGFLRFTRPYEDFSPRSVLGASSEGVLVLRDGGLEVRTTNTGAMKHELAFSGRREQLVIAGDRIFLLRNGALEQWRDGGVTSLTSTDTSTDAELASGDALFSWNATTGVLTRFDLSDDGGVTVQSVMGPPTVPGPLSVVSSDAIFGGAGRLTFDSDGGTLWAPFDFSMTPYSTRYERDTLSSPFATDVFVERCDDAGACETTVNSFDAVTGAPRWNAQVIGRGFFGRIVRSTLIDGNAGDGVVTVTELLADDGGTRGEVALFADGEQKALCHLPAASGSIDLAHFSGTALVLTTRRPDGGVVLESYGLGLLPVSRSGWPGTNGVNGSRSDR